MFPFRRPERAVLKGSAFSVSDMLSVLSSGITGWLKYSHFGSDLASEFITFEGRPDPYVGPCFRPSQLSSALSEALDALHTEGPQTAEAEASVQASATATANVSAAPAPTFRFEDAPQAQAAESATHTNFYHEALTEAKHLISMAAGKPHLESFIVSALATARADVEEELRKDPVFNPALQPNGRIPFAHEERGKKRGARDKSGPSKKAKGKVKNFMLTVAPTRGCTQRAWPNIKILTLLLGPARTCSDLPRQTSQSS